MTVDPRRRGVILVNVLAMVAVASLAVMLMTASQDIGLDRSQRFAEAVRAASIARAGEASARAALRRDMIDAPAVDHLREPWAAVADAEVPIEGGSFALAIKDAQARFNINSLLDGGVEAESLLARIVAARRLPAPTAVRIAGFVRTVGPIDALADLAQAGVTPQALAALGPYVDALPGRTSVNVNTASETLLAVMLGNPVAARVLASRRARAGLLTSDDLAAARAILPPGAGYTSDYFRVTTTVRIGETTQALSSLLARRRRDNRVEVVAIVRRRGPTA